MSRVEGVRELSRLQDTQESGKYNLLLNTNDMCTCGLAGNSVF